MKWYELWWANWKPGFHEPKEREGTGLLSGEAVNWDLVAGRRQYMLDFVSRRLRNRDQRTAAVAVGGLGVDGAPALEPMRVEGSN